MVTGKAILNYKKIPLNTLEGNPVQKDRGLILTSLS